MITAGIGKLLRNMFDGQDSYPSVRVIDTEHSKVHLGLAYRSHFRVQLSGGETKYIQIKTGSKELHFKERDVTVSDNNGPVYYTVLENPTVTDGTNTVPIWNSNRKREDNSDTLIYTNPTGVSGGNETDEVMVPDTGKTGASAGDSFEWEYDANDDIVVKIENTGTTTCTVLVRYKWYVEDFY